VNIGSFHKGFARARLDLPGRTRPLEVEFLIDTGFEGELSLPPHLAQLLDTEIAGALSLQLADGRIASAPYYAVEIEWQNDSRLTEILLLDGHPLLGIELLKGRLLQIETVEGGEVTLEPL
jgi:clan AA aspartic protease